MISPKAEINPKARIGKNVTIYPFAYIEDDVEIGDDCVIYPYVSVMKGTRIGRGNKIFQNTVLGAEPQDFNFRGDDSVLVIGDYNCIRENVVINRATFSDGKTVIGNHNFLMEGVHVSHDTKISDNCVFGYGTKIAGDCEIENDVIFSSNVIANAGVRVGRGSMIQGGSRFSKDIPPFIIAGREPIAYCGINIVGLRRRGFSNELIENIHNAYRIIYNSGKNTSEALEQVKKEVPMSPEIEYIITFIENSQRGIIR